MKILKSLWDLIIGEVPEIIEPIKEPVQEKKQEPEELCGFKIGNIVVFVGEKKCYPPKQSNLLKIVPGERFIIEKLGNYFPYPAIVLKNEEKSFEWAIKYDPDAFCKLEDVEKFQKIIDAEKDFKVEFKVRKREGVEDYSVWWRSSNHPKYREWQCIVNPKGDSNNTDVVFNQRSYNYPNYELECYHPYYFDSKQDVEEGIEILKTRDPKTLWAFERLWCDV